MTTLATGGYSTKSESLAAFNSSTIEIIIIFGMLVGSLPFVHYLALTKKGMKNLIKDDQVKSQLNIYEESWNISVSLPVPCVRRGNCSLVTSISLAKRSNGSPLQA